jgi:hypothetical protein
MLVFNGLLIITRKSVHVVVVVENHRAAICVEKVCRYCDRLVRVNVCHKSGVAVCVYWTEALP